MALPPFLSSLEVERLWLLGVVEQLWLIKLLRVAQSWLQMEFEVILCLVWKQLLQKMHSTPMQHQEVEMSRSILPVSLMLMLPGFFASLVPSTLQMCCLPDAELIVACLQGVVELVVPHQELLRNFQVAYPSLVCSRCYHLESRQGGMAV